MSSGIPSSGDMARLALRLTLNSIHVSSGEFKSSKENKNQEKKTPLLDRDKVYRMILNKGAYEQVKNLNDQYRCIVVVGAGASFNACKDLRLGKEFVKELKREFEGKSPWKTDLIENELSRLKKIYKLNPDEFETVLYAISKYYPKDLIEKLVENYDHRYNPGLTYEILAHLMKHRFIDAIINFNFDELLDQSIEDELKSDEYHRVLFDGDVNIEKIFINGEGLRYPLYIKPHGTISHSSSLRFTEEDYYGIPQKIEDIIKKLLSADDIKGGEMPVKIILVSIGFNMQSTEFNVLLNENLPEGSEIYFIKTTPEVPKIDTRALNLNGWGRPKLEQLANATVIIVDKEKGLDGTVNEIWDKITNNFSDNFLPRGINRHKLISTLFNESTNARNNENGETEKYLWHRAYIEFVLSVAKYKGFVCTNQLTEDRFGKYFWLALNKWNEFVAKKGKASPPNLHENKKPPSNLLELIEEFGFNDVAYGSKAFTNKLGFKKGKNYDHHQNESLTIFHEAFFNVLLPSIKQKLIYLGIEKLKNPKVLQLFEETMKTLYSSEDTEISPKFTNIYGQLFTKPKVIKTRLEIDLQTNHYLGLRDWNVMYAVAETGEWLKHNLDKFDPSEEKFKNKEIHLIYADKSNMTKELNRLVKKHGAVFKPHYLYWWEHNQHLTIFLKKDKNGKKEKFEVLRAIYFARRLRISHISPILLEDNLLDCIPLLEIYEAYLLKSSNSMSKITKDEIREKMEKYKFV